VSRWRGKTLLRILVDLLQVVAVSAAHSLRSAGSLGVPHRSKRVTEIKTT